MYFLAESNEIIRLIDNGTIVPVIAIVIAIVMGCTIAIVAIIACNVSNVAIAKAREQSRRELAAYVAEGTMAPENAVALMNAGKSSCDLSEIDSMNA